MTVNSISQIASTPFCGLGTQTYNVPTTGLYTVSVNVTLPWQTSDQPSTVAPTAEVQNVATVADVSGSLNSTFWTFYTAGNANGYYVWYNINSAGVDPAPAGLTGIAVTGATNATANTLAASTRTAVAAAVSGSLVTVSGATNNVGLTNVQYGACTAAADGTATTGFTFTASATGTYGSASGLVIKVNHGATNVYTLSEPTPTQPFMAGSATVQCTAGDTLTVVLTSLATADAKPNAVKGIINVFAGPV